MKKLKEIASYIDSFSKLQAVVAFGAGAGTTYYMSMLLLPIVGNLAGYVLGASSGTFVGLVTVYGAERDIQNLVQEKKTDNYLLRKECHESQSLYLKNKGKYETLDLQQISDQHIQKIFSRIHTIISKLSQSETITDTDPEEKSQRPRTMTKTVITGGCNKRSEDEIEKIILDVNIKEIAIEHSSDVSFLRKVWQFMRESKPAAKVTIVTNLAMISYYIQYSLANSAGVEDLIAWPISITLGLLASPVITYLTAAPAQDELARLRQEYAFLQGTSNRLIAANVELQRHLGDMKELTTSADEYKQLATTLKEASVSTINIGFLGDSLKKFNETGKKKKQFQARPLPAIPTSSNTTLSDLTRPLLQSHIFTHEIRLTSPVNNSDETKAASAPWQCAIL